MNPDALPFISPNSMSCDPNFLQRFVQRCLCYILEELFLEFEQIKLFVQRVKNSKKFEGQLFFYGKQQKKKIKENEERLHESRIPLKLPHHFMSNLVDNCYSILEE